MLFDFFSMHCEVCTWGTQIHLTVGKEGYLVLRKRSTISDFLKFCLLVYFQCLKDYDQLFTGTL